MTLTTSPVAWAVALSSLLCLSHCGPVSTESDAAADGSSDAALVNRLAHRYDFVRVERPTDERVYAVSPTGEVTNWLGVDPPVALLLEAGRPAEHTITIARFEHRTCIGLSPGTLAAFTIDRPDNPSIVTSVEGSSIRIRATGDATVSLTIRSTLTTGDAACPGYPPAGTLLPIAIPVTVSARNSARPVFRAPAECEASSRYHFVGGRRLELDAAYEEGPFANFGAPPFSFALHSESPISVLSTTDIMVPTARGRMILESYDRRALMEVQHGLTARDLSSVTARFYIQPVAAAEFDLTDGMSYSWTARRLARAINFKIDAASVGPDRVCDAVPRSWFTFTSETPAVCEIGSAPQGVGDRIARLLTDGTCTVRIESADADGGRGIVQRITTTHSNVVALSPI